MKKENSTTTAPFSIRQVNRLLVVVIVLLALFSGYFHAKYTNEVARLQRLQKKYTNLETKYDSLLEAAATQNEVETE